MDFAAARIGVSGARRSAAMLTRVPIRSSRVAAAGRIPEEVSPVRSKLKWLLLVTAIVELGAGAMLLLVPSLTTELLLGAGLAAAESAIVGRVAGAALLSIGLNCWLERRRDPSSPPVGLLVGLLLYNLAIALLFVDAAVQFELSGVALWPACIAHVLLFGWCVACLRAGSDGAAQSGAGRTR